MTKPLIYISYGMAKSGSTLAYQLTATVLEAGGAPQPPIDLPGVVTSGLVNFVEVIRPYELSELKAYAQDAEATPIVIKTHCGLWDCVARGLDEGWIIGHAVCRDPREIALSMMDASRENRAWGKRHGEPLRNIEDALEAVRHNAEKFQKWAAHPAIMNIAYPRIGFDTANVAAQIADQLGLEVDAARCAKAATKLGTNANKARPRRHEKELSAQVNSRIQTEFQNFIDTYCEDDFRPKKPGLMGRIFG